MKDFTPRKVVLENPITYGENTIHELTFSRPVTAGDLRGIPLNNMCFDHMFLVAGRLCAQPPKVMEMIQGHDVTSVTEVVGDFLSGGQRTGS